MIRLIRPDRVAQALQPDQMLQAAWRSGFSRKCVFAALAILAMGLTAQADELQLRPGMTGVADLGALSCETFNQMYPNGPTGMRQSSLYFAEGFIFALSGQTIDELLLQQSGEWNFDSLTDIIVEYCAAHPDYRVSDAANELWSRLSPGQVNSAAQQCCGSNR